MRTVIYSKDLLNALLLAFKAVPSKALHPIYECFYFNGKGGDLEIITTNGSQSIYTQINAKEAEGSVVLPAAQLFQLAKVLPNEEITIRTKNDNVCEVIWSNGRADIPHFEVADFPSIKFIGDTAFTVKAEALKEAINSTISSTADDKVRPFLNALYFDIENDNLTVVGSDSQILSTYKIEVLKGGEVQSFILPKEFLMILKDFINDEDIKVTTDGDSVQFAIGGSILMTKTVIYNYPNYKRLFPSNLSDNVVIFDRKELISAIKRISLCSNRENKLLKFTFEAIVGVKIEAQNQDFQTAAKEAVQGAEYAGESIVLGLKTDSLINILSSYTCERIKMYVTSPSKAVFVTPESEGICMKSLVMPMVIKE